MKHMGFVCIGFIGWRFFECFVSHVVEINAAVLLKNNQQKSYF